MMAQPGQPTAEAIEDKQGRSQGMRGEKERKMWECAGGGRDKQQ